jgi:hypothetical protein
LAAPRWFAPRGCALPTESQPLESLAREAEFFLGGRGRIPELWKSGRRSPALAALLKSDLVARSVAICVAAGQSVRRWRVEEAGACRYWIA